MSRSQDRVPSRFRIVGWLDFAAYLRVGLSDRNDTILFAAQYAQRSPCNFIRAFPERFPVGRAPKGIGLHRSEIRVLSGLGRGSTGPVDGVFAAAVQLAGLTLAHDRGINRPAPPEKRPAHPARAGENIS